MPAQVGGTSVGGCLGAGTCHLRDVPYKVPKPVRRGVPREAAPGASHLCFSSSALQVRQLPQGSGSCNLHGRLRHPRPTDHHRLLQVVSAHSSLPVLCSASGTNGIPTAAGPGPEHLPCAHRPGSRGYDRQILELYLVEVCSVWFLIHSKK